MNKILFIVNPHSGLGNQKNIKNIVSDSLDFEKFSPEFIYTERPGHGYELSKTVALNFDIIVAVGGDGTVNEVSRGLLNTQKIFGIVPAGSGNGLARFLKIPMKPSKAIQTINNLKINDIDSCIINNRHFVNVAGVGFDAFISHLFDKYGKRGPISYAKIIIKEFFSFQPTLFSLIIDGKTVSENAYLITFANSSTYGNMAHIAPQAKIDDGIIEVAIVKSFPHIFAPIFAIRLYAKTMHRSKYVQYYQARQITMAGFDKIDAHVDGDPVTFYDNITIGINPKSLKIIVGERFK